MTVGSLRGSFASLWKKAGVFVVPALFGLFSVLEIFSASLGEVDFSQIVRSLIVSLALSFCLTLLLSVLIRDRVRASLVAVCWLIVFFPYPTATPKTCSSGRSVPKSGVP